MQTPCTREGLHAEELLLRNPAVPVSVELIKKSLRMLLHSTYTASPNDLHRGRCLRMQRSYMPYLVQHSNLKPLAAQGAEGPGADAGAFKLTPNYGTLRLLRLDQSSEVVCSHDSGSSIRSIAYRYCSYCSTKLPVVVWLWSAVGGLSF